jgi:hypothetical protein
MARGVGVIFDVLLDLERRIGFASRKSLAAADNNQPVSYRDNMLDAFSCCFLVVEDSNGKRCGGDISRAPRS